MNSIAIQNNCLFTLTCFTVALILIHTFLLVDINIVLVSSSIFLLCLATVSHWIKCFMSQEITLPVILPFSQSLIKLFDSFKSAFDSIKSTFYRIKRANNIQVKNYQQQSQLIKHESFNSFCGSQLEFSNEAHTFAKLIGINYVNFWYNSLSNGNQQFLANCQLALEQIFINLINSFQNKLSTPKLAQIFLQLIHSNLAYFNDNNYDNENDQTILVANIVERLLNICSPHEINFLIEKSQTKNYAVYLMIKKMLTEAVFIPIFDVITNPQWIYSNIIFLCKEEPIVITHHVDDDISINEFPDEQTSNSLQDFNGFENNDDAICRNISTLNKTLSSSMPEIHISNIDLNLIESNRHFHSSDDLSANQIEEDVSQTESEVDFEKNSFVEYAEEAEEVDLKLFSNIKITNALSINSPEGSFILYCIEYDGLFEEVNHLSESPYLVTKKVNVKRRFREFVTLQIRLQENRILRKYIQDVKKPSTIKITSHHFFRLSYSKKLDDKTIEFRRRFLEEYLNQLCSIRMIAQSHELHHFLAYGTDARIAFVKTKSQTLLPLKLDKYITYGFKGALNLLKTALPVDSPQIGKIDPNANERVIENERLNVKTIPVKALETYKMELEKKLDKWNGINKDQFFFDSKYEAYKIDHHELGQCELGPRSMGDGCENCTNQTEISQSKSNQNNNYISFMLIDISLLLMDPEHSSHWIILIAKIIKFVFGQLFERLILRLLENISKEQCIMHLHNLHEALWPSITKNSDIRSDIPFHDSQQFTYQDAHQAILKSYSFKSSNINTIIFINQFSKNLLFKGLQFFNSKSRNKKILLQFLNQILDEIEK